MLLTAIFFMTFALTICLGFINPIIEQAKILGNEPFPYLLHRAHEIAVVSFREKEEIDQMLAVAIRSNGGEVGEISGKQSAKNLSGNTRR